MIKRSHGRKCYNKIQTIVNYYELNDITTNTKFNRKPYKLMCLTFQHKTKRVILILDLLQNLLHNIRNNYSFLNTKQKINS